MAKKKLPAKKKKSAAELTTENELLKLKMMAELGGNFVGSDNIPPDVENKFLKQIKKFHQLHDQSKLITIYKLIGEPEYDHVHDLSDKEVKKALRKMLSLMHKHGVALEVMAPTSDREIYRFITEELFKQEIEEIRIKGWVSQFVYEDFHPNPEYDVRNVAHFLILSVFVKAAPFFADYFSESMKDAIGLSTDIEEIKEKIDRFHAAYNNITLVDYEITNLHFDDSKTTCELRAEVEYKPQKEKGRRSKKQETEINLVLTKNAGNQLWEVKSVFSPVLDEQ